MRCDRRSERATVRARCAGLLLVVALVPLWAACQSDEEKIAGFKERGAAYSEEGKLREAVIEYRNALQINPNDAESHRGLAEVYLRLGDVNDAYWELSETIRLSPGDTEARNTYAAIALANGRFDEVLTQADALLELDPESEIGLVLRAQAYERLDRVDEVEAIMNQVIERNPERVEYLLLLSNFYVRQGRLPEAEASARRAMDLKPTYSGAAQLVRFSATDPAKDAETERLLLLGIDLAKQEQAARVQAADSSEKAEGLDSRGIAYKTTAGFYVARGRTDDAIALLDAASEAMGDAPKDRLELLYMLAGIYREQGNEEQATAVMRRAAESAEGNPDPYLVLSTYRSGEQDFAGALEAAELALGVDPAALKTRLRHAEVLIEYGVAMEDAEKLAQGESELDALVADYPGLPEGLFVIGKLAMAQQNWDRAIEVLSAALEGKPDWPQARLLLGSALFGKGELSRARVEMALALELDPTLIQARRGLIKIHAALGEHEYAIDQGKQYLDQRPKDNEIRIVLAQSYVRVGRMAEAKELLQAFPEEHQNTQTRFAMARIALAEGDLDTSRRLMEEVETEMPHHERVLETFLSLDQAQGRLDDSKARVSAAIEANPESSELREIQGLVAALQGDQDLAEKSYEKSIELDPKRLSAYSKLAGLYQSQGRVDDTITIYEQAVAEDPKAAQAHHFLGVLYEMTGKPDKAREHYDVAIAADDGMSESKNNLAYLLASGGTELDRALSLAQEAKAAMPGNPNTADTLGWVLLKRGVPTAAVGYFREALANMPPNEPARGEVEYHLALGYAAAGQKQEAIASLQSALAFLDQQLDAARASGGAASEPAWASQARAELKRLSS